MRALEGSEVRMFQPHPPVPGSVATEPNVFGRLSRLPALRPSTLKLLSISLDRESAIADFEHAFKSDPSLAADLLIVANSPAFSIRATVNSIRHAITLLGLERVRSLAMMVAVKGYLRTGRWNEAIQVAWRHSIATAVVAEALGSAEERSVPLLYTAGLLHDIGRLALFQVSSDKYGEILANEFSSTQEYINLERLLFGCGHDDAGAFLAAAWGFPVSLCDCIRFHHWDIAAHAGQFFELVGVACRMADCLGYSEVHRTDLDESPEAMREILPARLRNASALDPDVLIAQIETQLASFHISSPAGPTRVAS